MDASCFYSFTYLAYCGATKIQNSSSSILYKLENIKVAFHPSFDRNWGIELIDFVHSTPNNLLEDFSLEIYYNLHEK